MLASAALTVRSISPLLFTYFFRSWLCPDNSCLDPTFHSNDLETQRISRGANHGRRISAGGRQTRTGTLKSETHASRLLATHVESELEPELAEEEYISMIPQAGYTSRHVLSIFPPMPVLDKLQELQGKLSARTRIVPVPRPNMQIVLVPLGTSLEDPGKLREAKSVR